MEKLKIGVIGTGHLGKFHIKLYKQIDDCDLVGIFDINNAAAQNAGNEFGVKVFDDVEDLLNEVNAVSIAAPTSAHYEVAKKCLEKNIHVFVEKPINV